jgi:hypothetical protein
LLARLCCSSTRCAGLSLPAAFLCGVCHPSIHPSSAVGLFPPSYVRHLR